MKITKIGHCCLVVEDLSVTLMTDPGNWSTGQTEVTGLDAVLVTHEHADHLHIDSLKKVLVRNPQARIITNSAVHAILHHEGIVSEIVGNGQACEVRGIRIEGFGTEHAKIYKDQPQVENTGYFIGDTLFYPGDNWNNPGKPVDILALPVGGPWMKMSEALEFAIQIQPRIAFPVHDALFNDAGIELAHRWPEKILAQHGIQFVAMSENSVASF